LLWELERRMQVGPDEGEINVHHHIKGEPLVPDHSTRSTLPVWNWFHTSAPAFCCSSGNTFLLTSHFSQNQLKNVWQNLFSVDLWMREKQQRYSMDQYARRNGRVGTGLSVLWVAYATHSTLKPVHKSVYELE
jgi:hypothetical protein